MAGAKIHHIGSCKLCLSVGPLRKSHILPEFMYKQGGMYGENNRFLAVPRDPNYTIPSRGKGIREHLLCSKCEGLLNRSFEDYACKTLYLAKPRDSWERMPLTPSQQAICSTTLDYAKLKLFFLSLIWRLSHATRDELRKVQLEAKDQEIMREMILSTNPGSQHFYPCIVSLPLLTNGEPLCIMTTPIETTFRASQAWGFCIGFYYFLFVVAPQIPDPELDALILQPSGRMLMLETHFSRIPDLLQRGLEVRKRSIG